ncbi:MAG: putative transposase [Bacteroidia bacterium]
MLLHHFNALTIDFISTIPASTLSNWKRKNVSEIIGCNSLSDNDVSILKEIDKSKKLLRAAKALYVLFHTITQLFNHAQNKAELLRQHKTTILKTIEKVQPILGIKRILKSIGLTSSKMYYWLEKKKCENSIFNLCQPRHPHQLLSTEVNTIKNYLLNERFENWSALSIYYQALREKAVFMGISTWYKYSNRLGIKQKFFKLNKKREIGIRASRPFEILHMDVTIFKPLDQTKVYIYFIVDNFYRAILNWKASLEYSSTIALDVLKEAMQKHEIGIDSTLVTDGGPENHDEVSKFLSGKENIKQVIAQEDIIQSNSMVEAVNKHIKYYYLFKKNLKDIDDIKNYLRYSVVDYNDKPHGGLYGL